jgi:hypothetical protein
MSLYGLTGTFFIAAPLNLPKMRFSSLLVRLQLLSGLSHLIVGKMAPDSVRTRIMGVGTLLLGLAAIMATKFVNL